MLRFSFVVCALPRFPSTPSASAQNAAAFQWIGEWIPPASIPLPASALTRRKRLCRRHHGFSNFPVLHSLQQYSKPSNGAPLGDVYVTKLDPSGNLVYSTLFGGTGNDLATAMTVDSSGSVYVTGTTTSKDFPVTPGAYATSGGSFVFKLNPDGSLGYSTYLAPFGPSENTTTIGNVPAAIAVDSSGSAYIAGNSNGGMPVTSRAFQPTCATPPPIGLGPFSRINTCGFASRF